MTASAYAGTCLSSNPLATLCYTLYSNGFSLDTSCLKNGLSPVPFT